MIPTWRPAAARVRRRCTSYDTPFSVGMTGLLGEKGGYHAVTGCAHPGPALLDVKVNRMELVMPPAIGIGQAASTALYGAKAILSGRAGDVLELAGSNFVR